MKKDKKVKETVIGIAVVVLIVTAVTLVYVHEKNKVHRDLAKRIAELSPKGGLPQTVEGLREAIAAYEKQIELNVQEGAQTGVYWKILAIRLADKGMHRDALDALERSIHFNTQDPTLYYLSGDYASIVAASLVGFSENAPAEQSRFHSLAEASYLRAIDLDDSYAKPLLGLGILYAFDMGMPAEAVPLLEKYLTLLPNNIAGMFVLARAYFMTEQYSQAVEQYDRILARTKDPNVKAEAQNNKELIGNLMYE